jgi:hypothetical protein
MTLAVFTLSGKCEVIPPYIFRPTTRLAYCTGMRRCPRSTKMIAPTRTTASTSNEIATRAPISPSRTNVKVVETAEGKPATIPAKIINDMPLPIPRSVICSPSHIIKAVPEVSVMTVIRRKYQPGVRTRPKPPGPRVLSRPILIIKP